MTQPEPICLTLADGTCIEAMIQMTNGGKLHLWTPHIPLFGVDLMIEPESARSLAKRIFALTVPNTHEEKADAVK